MKHTDIFFYILFGLGLISCQPTAIEPPIIFPTDNATHPGTILQTPQLAQPTPVDIPPTWTPDISAEAEIFPPTPFPTFTPGRVDAVVSTPSYPITSFKLPDDCYENSTEVAERWGKEDFLPCSDFAYSPDGQFVGFYYGPLMCIRGIIIQNTQTGDVVYRSSSGAGIKFEFLSNGKALVSTGHCEGGQVHLLDPTTGQLSSLGGWTDDYFWNSAKTAFVASVSSYHGVGGEVWGYDIEHDFRFLASDSGNLDDRPIWTPDDSYVLYHHRVVSYTYSADNYIESPEKYTFPEARQIIRVNAINGEKQILLSDAQFDYHFCAGAYRWCDQWYGDWIQVRRFQFVAQTLEFTSDFYHQSAVTCLIYGTSCTEQPELFALNWQTGEVIPWDDLQNTSPSTSTP